MTAVSNIVDLRLVLPLLIMCMMASTNPNQSEAAESFKGKAIGIVISESCLISPTCMNYADIIPIDNTNPVYSGAFIENDGDYARKCTSRQNSLNWLQYEKEFVIMVDPCLRQREQIPVIEIYPQLDWYAMPGQMKITEDKDAPDRTATHQIQTYSRDRHVDSSCTNAKITAKNWKYILPDTINYLRAGCDPNSTLIQTVETVLIEKTIHDISTSYKYKLEKQYDWVKANCLKSFGSCPELGVDPHRKASSHFILNLVG